MTWLERLDGYADLAEGDKVRTQKWLKQFKLTFAKGAGRATKVDVAKALDRFELLISRLTERSCYDAIHS